MEYPNSILKELEKRVLSSVEFVRDYYQLRFNGPQINVLNNPKIRIDSENWILSDEKEFCYFLLKCIGEMVDEINLQEESFFEIQFHNGFTFHVSLKPEDYLENSPEALLYWNEKGKLDGIW